MAERCYAECHLKALNAECRYSECHYAERRGANVNNAPDTLIH
jgi:hypothetical protein